MRGEEERRGEEWGGEEERRTEDVNKRRKDEVSGLTVRRGEVGGFRS